MSPYRTVLPPDPAAAAEQLAETVTGGGTPLVISGGTLAVPALQRGELTPTVLVDLHRAGLDTVVLHDGYVEIGATVTYQRILDSPALAERVPLLHRVAGGITGGIQIRNQATVAGALCAARPQSDAPATAVALGARVVVRSVRGTRIVPVEEFLTGAGRTDLAADELVEAVRIPVGPAPRRCGYAKLKFAESSWPVVTAAALATAAPGATVVLGGVAVTPLRLPPTPPDRIGDVVADRLARLPPEQHWSDLRAGWAYRRSVAPTLAARALAAVAEEHP
ncbi:FAD binding domain-containing protein [Pseudonocardia nematodicida]|uniref:FAD binding domain-containing protein n=1 Tax=Pseudonocardia nematodicida TaxID=1206997 RepID=A0ABV1KIV8_9PSEU